VSIAPSFATVTLSPAIDITLVCDQFPVPGAVISGFSEVETPGGKGLNAARWLAQCGHSVIAAGLLGEANAAPFEAMLGRLGIRDALLRVPGENRRNVMVSSPQGMFKVNRRAFPRLQPDAGMIASVLQPCLAADVCVLAGSLPAALPVDVYATLIARLHAAGLPAVLDTSGEALEAGLRARPDVIKPNRMECEGCLGRTLREPSDFHQAAFHLLEWVPCVLISDGEAGCWFADREGGGRVFHASSPDVTVVDTTAAGDALLAEFCHGYFPNRRLNDALMRRACAAGAVATTVPGAETPPFEAIGALAAAVRITPG